MTGTFFQLIASVPMPMAHYLLPALLAFDAAAHAADRSAVVFQHKDWEIACDTTRTSRAAGYSDEADDIADVSVPPKRHAGPGGALSAQLRLAESDSGAARTIRMTIDQHDIGTIALDLKTSTGTLSPIQTAALLSAVLGNGSVVWRRQRYVEAVQRPGQCRPAQNGRVQGKARYACRARHQRQ